MIKQLAHICLLTDDLTVTEDFYCRILGMRKQFEFEKEGHRFGLYLHAGGNTFIEVFEAGVEENNDHPPMKHLCLEVDDIDATIRQLEDEDIEVTPKKMGADNSWQAWCRDPSGVDIEFHQYTPDSFQFNGGTCIMD